MVSVVSVLLSEEQMNPKHVLAITTKAQLSTDLSLGLIHLPISLSQFTLPVQAGSFVLEDSLDDQLGDFLLPELDLESYDELQVLGHRVYTDGSVSMSIRYNAAGSKTFQHGHRERE